MRHGPKRCGHRCDQQEPLVCSLLRSSHEACGAEAPLVLHIKDYATAPMTGSTTGTGNGGSLARINMLREEPGGAGRFFVNDLNGPLVHPRQEHQGVHDLPRLQRPRRPGPGSSTSFRSRPGYANGFISFQFDPDYRRNGKFYTIHLEEPAAPGSVLPDATQRARAERRRIHADPADHDARHDRARSHRDRVDRHEHLERDLRGHRRAS